MMKSCRSTTKKKKKERTWAEAATSALLFNPDKMYGIKEILQTIHDNNLKDISLDKAAENVLATMLNHHAQLPNCPFYRVKGRIGLYALKESWLKKQSETFPTEMTEIKNVGNENVSVPSTAPGQSNQCENHYNRENHAFSIQGKSLQGGINNKYDVPHPSFQLKNSLTRASALSSRRHSSPVKIPYRSFPSRRRPIITRAASLMSRYSPHTNHHHSNTFAKHALTLDLESPSSILVHANMRVLVNKTTFSRLPPSYRNQLTQLLPDCDQALVAVGPEKEQISAPSDTALTNEFFTQAVQEWKDRLVDGEFTRETQSRIMQEIAKERSKIDPWKEKFFEEYYGQKKTSTKRLRSRSQNLAAEAGHKMRDLGMEAQLAIFAHLRPELEESCSDATDSEAFMSDDDDDLPLQKLKSSRPSLRTHVLTNSFKKVSYAERMAKSVLAHSKLTTRRIEKSGREGIPHNKRSSIIMRPTWSVGMTRRDSPTSADPTLPNEGETGCLDVRKGLGEGVIGDHSYTSTSWKKVTSTASNTDSKLTSSSATLVLCPSGHLVQSTIANLQKPERPPTPQSSDETQLDDGTNSSTGCVDGDVNARGKLSLAAIKPAVHVISTCPAPSETERVLSLRARPLTPESFVVGGNKTAGVISNVVKQVSSPLSLAEPTPTDPTKGEPLVSKQMVERSSAEAMNPVNTISYGMDHFDTIPQPSHPATTVTCASVSNSSTTSNSNLHFHSSFPGVTTSAVTYTKPPIVLSQHAPSKSSLMSLEVSSSSFIPSVHPIPRLGASTTMQPRLTSSSHPQLTSSSAPISSFYPHLSSITSYMSVPSYAAPITPSFSHHQMTTPPSFNSQPPSLQQHPVILPPHPALSYPHYMIPSPHPPTNLTQPTSFPFRSRMDVQSSIGTTTTQQQSLNLSQQRPLVPSPTSSPRPSLAGSKRSFSSTSPADSPARSTPPSNESPSPVKKTRTLAEIKAQIKAKRAAAGVRPSLTPPSALVSNQSRVVSQQPSMTPQLNSHASNATNHLFSTTTFPVYFPHVNDSKAPPKHGTNPLSSSSGYVQLPTGSTLPLEKLNWVSHPEMVGAQGATSNEPSLPRQPSRRSPPSGAQEEATSSPLSYTSSTSSKSTKPCKGGKIILKIKAAGSAISLKVDAEVLKKEMKRGVQSPSSNDDLSTDDSNSDYSDYDRPKVKKKHRGPIKLPKLAPGSSDTDSDFDKPNRHRWSTAAGLDTAQNLKVTNTVLSTPAKLTPVTAPLIPVKSQPVFGVPPFSVSVPPSSNIMNPSNNILKTSLFPTIPAPSLMRNSTTPNAWSTNQTSTNSVKTQEPNTQLTSKPNNVYRSTSKGKDMENMQKLAGNDLFHSDDSSDDDHDDSILSTSTVSEKGSESDEDDDGVMPIVARRQANVTSLVTKRQTRSASNLKESKSKSLNEMTSSNLANLKTT